MAWTDDVPGCTWPLCRTWSRPRGCLRESPGGPWWALSAERNADEVTGLFATPNRGVDSCAKLFPRTFAGLVRGSLGLCDAAWLTTRPQAHLLQVSCPPSSLVFAVANPHQSRPCKIPHHSSRSPLRNSCQSPAKFSRIRVRSSRPKPRMHCLSVSPRAPDCPQVAVAMLVPAPDRQISRRSLSLAHPWTSHHEPSRGSPSAASPRLQPVVNGRRLEGNANSELQMSSIFLNPRPLRIIPRAPHILRLPRETSSTSAQTVPCLRSV